MKRSDYIWMRVSQDEYELPTAVADSRDELAKMCHTTVNKISSQASRAKVKRYIKVYVGGKRNG